MTPFRAPDGTLWGAEVRLPSHSGAFVIFHHPAPDMARLNRYAWLNARTDETRDPGSRLDPGELSKLLDDRALARLFRRSMPVNSDRPRYIAS